MQEGIAETEQYPNSTDIASNEDPPNVRDRAPTVPAPKAPEVFSPDPNASAPEAPRASAPPAPSSNDPSVPLDNLVPQDPLVGQNVPAPQDKMVRKINPWRAMRRRRRPAPEHPAEWAGKLFGLITYTMNPLVFGTSLIIIWGFIIWCLVDDDANTRISEIQTHLVQNYSWLYVGAVVGFLTLMVILLFHPTYSQIKLGKPGVAPKYSMMTWFAMLFSASYGNDLYYYGVAQPVLHFRDAVEGWNRYGHLPPPQQAVAALNMSWFHTGFMGLGIYCVVGLSIGFLAHRHDMPVTVRTCFYPILGNRVNGVLGDLIDTAAVIATMFGLATNLGLGVMQINAGLQRVFDAPYSANSQIVIIWIITLMATVSVVTGVDKGIKYLSQFNFALGCFLIMYLFFSGDSFFILNLFVETCGQHFQTLPGLYTKTDSFEQIGFDDESDSPEWMGWWTVFYWGWWIAWSPFVGTFIAQIAQGRTVRVFILGNMIVPTLVTAMWTAIMGGLGLQMEFEAMELNLGNDCHNANATDPITNGTITRLSCASADHQMFMLFEHYPLAQFVSVLGLIGILGYFVTSSDSASFVIDMITSNGMVESPKIQRVFWALSEGAAATALLAAGGTNALTALQTASIAAAFPFIILLIIMVGSLLRAFEMDDEFLARRGVKAHSPKNMELGAPQQIHNPVASGSTLSPMNAVNGHDAGIAGNSAHLDQLSTAAAIPLQVDIEPKSEPKPVPTEWRIGLCEDVCMDPGVFFESLCCCCCMIHPNGQRVGMYQVPCHGRDSQAWQCADIFWFLGVAGVPFLLVGLRLAAAFEVEGFAALASVIWVFYMLLGALHRMKIREYYNVRGNPLFDVAAYCCCYCLAVRQESVQCENIVLL